jgi:hypothetical protein
MGLKVKVGGECRLPTSEGGAVERMSAMSVDGPRGRLRREERASAVGMGVVLLFRQTDLCSCFDAGSAEDSVNDALDCRFGNASRWDGGLQALECCLECFALDPVFSRGGGKGNVSVGGATGNECVFDGVDGGKQQQNSKVNVVSK